MPKTQTQRTEIALLRIIEDTASTIDQILEASRQLIGIKRVKAAPRSKRIPKESTLPNKDMLGSK